MSREEGWVWVDGVFLGGQDPVPEADGPSLSRAVFETFLGSASALPTLSLHLSRLSWAAGCMGCLPLPPLDYAGLAGELLGRAGLAKGRFRLVLFPPGSVPRLLFSVEPPPADLRDRRARGVVLVTSPFRRSEGDPRARVKVLSRGFHERAREEARARGGEDALLLGPRGEVLEATTANLFFLTGEGELRTPSLNGHFLAGVTRARLIEACRREGPVLRQRTFRLPELLEAEEVFLTNAVYQAYTVRRIDGRDFPVPGRLARWLQLLGQG